MADNKVLAEACFRGDKECVLAEISRGACDWEWGLANACRGGHRELIELMITFGAKDWTRGLQSACKGGHKEIVDLMISYANRHRVMIDWNCGLLGACHGGQKDFVIMMMARGANNWNMGLEGACQGNQKEMAELMIQLGANRWSEGLHGACRAGYIEMVNLMIAHSEREGKAIDWNLGLIGACRGGQIDMVKLMIEKGANNLDEGMNQLYKYEDGHKEIALFLLTRGATTQWNLDNLTDKDIEYLVLHNAKFTDKYESTLKRCLVKFSSTLTKLLYPHLLDELISIFLCYIW